MFTACSFYWICFLNRFFGNVLIFNFAFHYSDPRVGIWAISLVVEQRSPKPLAGVRFPHRPPQHAQDSLMLSERFVVARR